MTKENLVSLNVSAEDLKEIQNAIVVLGKKLMPLLLELSADEKIAIPKMKDKTIAFVTKSYEHSVQNPQLVPPYVDVEELRKDIAAVELLRNIIAPLEKIIKASDDTMTVAGSEAYLAALAFYQSVKIAAKGNISGAQVVVDDLAPRFDYSRKKKEKPTTTSEIKP